MKTPVLTRLALLAAITALLVAAALPGAARGAVVIVAPTATTNGMFTITAPITFTLSADLSNGGFLFVLDELASTADAAQTFSNFSPGLSLSIDGVPTNNQVGSFADNFANSFSALTPRDGYFVSNTSFSAASGSTVTLLAATYTLAAAANFNPLDAGTFTGNMFITDSGANQISNVVSAGPVPEPSTWALLGLGIGMLALALRGRQRTA